MHLELIAQKEKEGKDKLLQTISRIDLNRLSESTFYAILLQRHWLSHSFTPVYDIVLNSLSIEADFAKPIIRKIIREEYPGKMPSHREDLITDLLQIGIKHSEIKKTAPTEETTEVIKEVFNLIHKFSNDENFSYIMLLTFLRYWSEVLTALEYELLWPRIKKLLNGKDSVFYFPHMVHDKDTDDLCVIAKARSKGGFTHSDMLGRRLVKMISITQNKFKASSSQISKDSIINSVIEVINYSTMNKVNFYGQFKSL